MVKEVIRRLSELGYVRISPNEFEKRKKDGKVDRVTFNEEDVVVYPGVISKEMNEIISLYFSR